MMTEIIHHIGSGLILAGAFFVLSGAVGLVRFPDFFTRLHPAGVVDSLGLPLVILGLALHAGFTLTGGKLLLLLGFVLLISPTACHALAKAAFLAEESRDSEHSKLRKRDVPHVDKSIIEEQER